VPAAAARGAPRPRAHAQRARRDRTTVWAYDLGPEANALRVHVGYLRRKLAQAGARPAIHTVRGVGYVLRDA
jgi:DNA-binding response OmpR family regulator